ncbi:MAG TPA: cell wall-binding repeat-containing protein [Acidothermaceae bacterium]
MARYQGADRFATSAAIVDANYRAGVPVAYVATGVNFPDALAGGAAAANEGGPLLLVAPDSIPSSIATELQRLEPGRVVVLGGERSVSAAVQSALGSYTTGSVTRVSGADRYATAAALAADFPSGAPVYVATGVDFPDALSATAAAAARHAAILLTEPNAIPDSTAAALSTLRPSSITIVGGTSVVSAAVADQLAAYSPTVTRVSGADRYGTAASVATAEFPSATSVFLASGVTFADALTGGPVAGAHGAPLMLSAPTCLPSPTAARISSSQPANVTLLGGLAALSQGVASLTTCPVAPANQLCGSEPTGTRYSHVVWIWMENKPYGSVIGSSSAPYENTLARQCGLASNYYGVAHPSLPNYLAATGGSTFGVTDDNGPSAHPIAAPSLFSQLTAAGLTWRAYEESMPANCALNSAAPYAVKHNPAAYYTNIRTACASSDVPLEGNLSHDIAAGALPSFAFVTPNLCNDTHDCAVATGDAWLSTWIPAIIAGPNYRAGNTLIVLTWDEGTGASNQVPTIVIAPSVRPGTVVGARLDHYALLRGAEDLLGLGRLGAASTAPSLAAAFGL